MISMELRFPRHVGSCLSVVARGGGHCSVPVTRPLRAGDSAGRVSTGAAWGWCGYGFYKAASMVTKAGFGRSALD